MTASDFHRRLKKQHPFADSAHIIRPFGLRVPRAVGPRTPPAKKKKDDARANDLLPSAGITPDAGHQEGLTDPSRAVPECLGAIRQKQKKKKKKNKTQRVHAAFTPHLEQHGTGKAPGPF